MQAAAKMHPMHDTALLVWLFEIQLYDGVGLSVLIGVVGKRLTVNSILASLLSIFKIMLVLNRRRIEVYTRSLLLRNPLVCPARILQVRKLAGVIDINEQHKLLQPCRQRLYNLLRLLQPALGI